MKTCKGCGAQKPLEEYYGNGYGQTLCKICYAARVRENRKAKADQYREYEQSRANLPHRVKARKEYAATARGKERIKAGQEKWIKQNPQKRSAHNKVSNAVRDGRLIKKPCAECGAEKSHAHHEDYAKPLDVVWLCQRCHQEYHKRQRHHGQKP